MMKIMDHVQEKVIGLRATSSAPLTKVAYNVEPVSRMSEPLREWEIELAVSCRLTGPADAHAVIKERAMRMISREIFGELYSDLRHLNELLYLEAYRPNDDPVLVKLGEIINKVEGVPRP